MSALLKCFTYVLTYLQKDAQNRIAIQEIRCDGKTERPNIAREFAGPNLD